MERLRSKPGDRHVADSRPATAPVAARGRFSNGFISGVRPMADWADQLADDRVEVDAEIWRIARRRGAF